MMKFLCTSSRYSVHRFSSSRKLSKLTFLKTELPGVDVHISMQFIIFYYYNTIYIIFIFQYISQGGAFFIHFTLFFIFHAFQFFHIIFIFQCISQQSFYIPIHFTFIVQITFLGMQWIITVRRNDPLFIPLGITVSSRNYLSS